MNYLTWKDVGVPETLIQFVKKALPGRSLDSLVYQMVFKHHRRAVFSYFCDYCGYVYRPDRPSEEVASCRRCDSVSVHCQTDLSFAKEVTAYSSYTFPTSLFDRMYDNYTEFFHRHPNANVNCGWSETGNYCQFPGGERYEGKQVRLTLLKSALLCPYLWTNVKSYSPLFRLLGEHDA